MNEGIIHHLRMFPSANHSRSMVQTQCIQPYSGQLAAISGWIAQGSDCHYLLKPCQLTCQQCYQVGTNFTFVLFLQLKKEGRNLCIFNAVFNGCVRKIMT